MYGTGFLVGAADVLEDIDAGKISGGTEYLSTEFSEDPLAGVLTGMGNNTKAALTYLSGTGSVDAEGNWVSDEETQKRWGKLTSRDWKNYGPSGNPNSWCSTGQDWFTDALAAASSYRNADSTNSNPESDARATYAAGKGIRYFGGEEWSKDDFSEDMQENMATVLANSPEELSAAATGGSYDEAGDGPSLGKQGVQDSDISTLVYRFGNNADAMATVSAEQVKSHSERINEAANTGSSATFGNKYRQAAATTVYLEQLSGIRCDDDIAQKNADVAAAQENKRKVVDTTVNVANTVLALGLSSGSGGRAAPAVHSLASHIAKPMTTDGIMTLLGSPEVAENNSTSNSYNMTKARGYGIEINHEILTGESSTPPAEYNTTGWCNLNENGKPYVDTQSLTPEQSAEMISWRNNCVANNEDNLALTQVDNTTDGGETDAAQQIAPAAPAQDSKEEEEQAETSTKPCKN